MNVVTSTSKRHRNDYLAINSMISSLSSWLAILLIQFPFYSRLCLLKLLVTIASIYRLHSLSSWISLLIVFSLLLSFSRFFFLVLYKHKSSIYTDITINLLSSIYTITTMISTKFTFNCIIANSLDVQIYNQTDTLNKCLSYIINLIYYKFISNTTT